MTVVCTKKGPQPHTMPVVDKLTPTEAKVWDLYKAGKKPREIAEELNMKASTVSRRLYAAKEKVFLS